MEPLSIRYFLTEDDYVKSMRYRIFKNRVLWALFVGFFMIGIGLKLLSPAVRGVSIIWLFLIAALPSLLYVYFIRPMVVVRRVRKYDRFQGERLWYLDEENIVFSSKYGETKTTWESLQRLEESKHHYHLVLTGYGRGFIVIPKRAFESPEQETAFRELIVQKGLTIK